MIDRTALDAAEVRNALAVLIDPAEYHELRGLPSGRSRLISGADLDAAVRAVAELAGDHGVYYTLNPVRPDLGDRAARVADIVRRAHFLIDIDPVKADPDASATDAEKTAAVALGARVLAHLNRLGWPLPIEIDSGNGYHLVYRIDLPNDKLAQQWLASCLKVLAKEFSGEQGTVDTKVHNVSRIAKLPGTWVRKGPGTAERPHRIARLVSVPLAVEVVPAELIQALAGLGAKSAPEATPAPAKDPWTIPVGTNGDGTAAYVQSAIERELGKVAMASAGERNDTLNRAAFALGTLIVPAHLLRSDLEAQLRLAGERAGLSEAEIGPTIRSGLDAGQAEPPDTPGAKAQAQR